MRESSCKCSYLRTTDLLTIKNLLSSHGLAAQTFFSIAYLSQSVFACPLACFPQKFQLTNHEPRTAEDYIGQQAATLPNLPTRTNRIMLCAWSSGALSYLCMSGRFVFRSVPLFCHFAYYRLLSLILPAKGGTLVAIYDQDSFLQSSNRMMGNLIQFISLRIQSLSSQRHSIYEIQIGHVHIYLQYCECQPKRFQEPYLMTYRFNQLIS